MLRPQLVDRAGPTRRDFLVAMFGAAAVALQFGIGVLALEQAEESDKAASEQQAEIEQTIKSLEQGSSRPEPAEELADR